MKIRRFYGKDMRDALNKVKAELGGDAVIMSNKVVADGIEIVAAYDKEPSAASKAAYNAQPNPMIQRPRVGSGYPNSAQGSGQTKFSVSAGTSAESPINKKVPTLSEIIGDTGPDSLRELMEQQSHNQHQQPEQPMQQTPSTASQASETRPTSNPLPSSAIEEIRSELHSLRSVLQYQVSGLLKQDDHRNHPMHGYLVARLESMGISPAIAEELVSYAPEDSDERQAWLFLLKLLANKVSTTGNAILNEKGIVALVGPTGTGKTTTIAKLAARFAQKYGPDQVALVTIDSYRIAAYEQLATYGKIIGCSVKKAQNTAELSDILFNFRNKRLVLIDTAGFGQRDSRLIKQLDTLNLESYAKIKKYLVLQASAQHKVMEHIVNAYKNNVLNGCILTKLDECYSLGEAISVAIEHKLAVSYITDGQSVPEDIKVADTKFLISTAAKLYKKYGMIHTIEPERFDSAMAV